MPLASERPADRAGHVCAGASMGGEARRRKDSPDGSCGQAWSQTGTIAITMEHAQPKIFARRSMASAVLLTGVAAVWVAAATWGFSYDDAYISYRYAWNLASGHGLVFNPGERVLGTTAPAYAALLGFLTWVTGISPVAWGTLAGLAGLLATAWAPWLLPSQQRPEWGWIVLWGLALLLARWNVELLGAETLVVMGLMSLAMVLGIGRGQLLAAGLLAAAAASLRFDGLLACGALGLVLWVNRPTFPWRYLVGILPFLGVLAAVTVYYGSPFPQSLEGKQAELLVRAGFAYTDDQWDWMLRDFGVLGARAIIAAAALGCWFLWRRGHLSHPLVLCCLAWSMSLEAFYRLVQVPFAPWYHVTTVALLLALAVWGCLAMADWLLRSMLSRPHQVGAAALGTLFTAPFVWASMQFLVAVGGKSADPRWDVYHDVGAFLEHHTDPGLVAMVEIGIAGYYAPAHSVLDLVGLVSPSVASKGAQRTFLEAEPRYVVDASLFHGRFPFLRELGGAGPDGANWTVLATFVDQKSGRGEVRVLERRAVEERLERAGNQQ